MARIRALKPDFFDDEDLAEHPFWVRILFEGLWCHADREGRLEDRPLKLKAKIFPYDKVDIAHGLDVLTKPKKHSPTHKSFIIRYSVNGENYLQIIEFSKHQSPHHTEKESVIPPPNGDLTVKEPLDKGEGGDAHSPKSMNLIHEVINYLNEKTGKGFRPDSKGTVTFIKARLAEGRTIEDFKKVIDTKVSKWKDKTWTDKRTGEVCQGNDFLRPSTLFRPDNFEAYLNEGPAGSPPGAWAEKMEAKLKADREAEEKP